MIGTCRDDDRITGMDNMLFFASEDELRFACLDAEELVHGIVHLVADLLPRLEAHHDKLSVFACEQDFTEIIVLEGQIFDISNETGHCFYLLIENEWVREMGMFLSRIKRIVAQITRTESSCC